MWICLFIAQLQRLETRGSFEEFFGKAASIVYTDLLVSHPAESSIMTTNSIYENHVGGAIVICTSKTLDVLIESCGFHFCSAGHDGGAIRVYGNNIGLVISRTCAYNCSTENSKRGAFCSVQSSYNKRFFITFTTVSSCADKLTDNYMYAPISIINSNSSILNTNVSRNNLYQYSGLEITDCYVYNLRFSTFSYNKASYSVSLYIKQVNSIESNSSFCNFIGNFQTGGLFYFGQTYSYAFNSFENCIFSENTDILFLHVASIYYVRLFSCYVFHFGNTLHFSGVSGMSSCYKLEPTSTHSLSHLATYKCITETQIGNLGQLSPCQTIPPIPTSCIIYPSSESLINNIKLLILPLSVLINLD